MLPRTVMSSRNKEYRDEDIQRIDVEDDTERWLEEV